ncbi:uncharacterized protein LOC143597314 [Bidens hawaiensis]|uniref:uncharacterized protein LOC143597314 n=1 Tax=Bidens hawaiensis TaxID=980011 RepID=UPI00404AD4E8
MLDGTWEGDENSRFFHGFINGSIKRSTIFGISINGNWESEPDLVKEGIFSFANKFDEQVHARPRLCNNNFIILSVEESLWLERPFSMEEVKDAVWACGNDKSPGPDGFTFKFIRHFWEVMGKDFFDFVKEFERIGFLENGCNSSFISLIPKKKDPIAISDYRPINLIGCDWNVRDTINLARLLRCFHLSSGLKVNFGKSKVFRVGVTDHEVGSMAEIIHCGSTSLPVTFLGLPIGANMGLSRHWDPIIEKVIDSLEKIRRNFLWGGTGINKKIKWVAWAEVLKPKLFGSLGAGDLNVMNLALLAKWWWRWRIEKESLWRWVMAEALDSGLIFGCAVLTVGAELVDTVWNWSRSRLSAEIPSDIADLKLMVVSYEFHTGKANTWRWIGDSSGMFSVQRLRGFLAEALYGVGEVPNHFWDRIPVAVNLISRGMVSVPPECHTCVSVYESMDHVFLECKRAKEVWRAVSLWCGWDITGFESIDQLVDVERES